MADIQIVRISQLPEASKVELVDAIVIPFNTTARRTVRKTWGEILLATLRYFASALGTITVASDKTLYAADATAGNFTITLPPAADSLGARITVKKVDVTAHKITIAGHGADLIDGLASHKLSTQWDYHTVECDGLGWYITG